MTVMARKNIKVPISKKWQANRDWLALTSESLTVTLDRVYTFPSIQLAHRQYTSHNMEINKQKHASIITFLGENSLLNT